MCLIAIGGRVKPASVLVLALAWPAGTHPPGPSSPTLYLGSCELPWRGLLWRQTQMTSFLWELRVRQCFSSDMECPGALGFALGTFMWGQHTPEPCPHAHSRPLCVCVRLGSAIPPCPGYKCWGQTWLWLVGSGGMVSSSFSLG